MSKAPSPKTDAIRKQREENWARQQAEAKAKTAVRTAATKPARVRVEDLPVEDDRPGPPRSLAKEVQAAVTETVTHRRQRGEKIEAPPQEAVDVVGEVEGRKIEGDPAIEAARRKRAPGPHPDAQPVPQESPRGRRRKPPELL